MFQNPKTCALVNSVSLNFNLAKPCFVIHSSISARMKVNFTKITSSYLMATLFLSHSLTLSFAFSLSDISLIFYLSFLLENRELVGLLKD